MSSATKTKTPSVSTVKTSKHLIADLSHYLGKYWKDTIYTWAFVFGEVILEILIAFFLQNLVRAIENSDPSSLYLWSGIMAGMAIGAAFCGIMAGFFAASAASGLGHNLREAMYRKIQDYSFENFDKFQASSLVTRTTTDVTNVQFSYMMSIRIVIRAPFMMLFALVMSFVTSWRISLIFLAVIPVLLFLLIVIANQAHSYFVRIFDTYDELNEAVEEDVDGIRVVKSFDRKNYHVGKFNRISDYIYENYVKVERLLSFNSPIMQTAVYGCILLVAVLASQEIVKNRGAEGALDTAALSTLFTYVMMILMSLMMVSMVYVMLTISRNSSERILEVLNEKPTIVTPEGAVTEVKNGAVDFDHVSFHYQGGPDVLHDVTLHFHSGETIGITGPTGSSKSTFVSLIARLYDPSQGTVKVDGIDVRKYDLKVLRDKVAVVLQKNTLFTGTIRDNLRWGKEDATDEEIWKACDLAQASEFLKTFPKGLDTPIEEGGTNVSGGQKQRLCIARALLKDPKILILDDSTSACDTHTDSLIREGLRSNRPDVTKFIIAQRVQSIKDCETILVFDEDGNIVANGNHDQLMETCPVYRDLYNSQVGGGDFDAN